MSAVSAAGDQVGTAGAGEVAGQEGIAAKIDAVDAAEQEAELPDQLVAPIGPPASRSRPARRMPAFADGGTSATVRIAISTSGMPQIASDQRQESSTSGSTRGSVEHDRDRFPDQQSVGVDRRAEAHLLRQPLPNQRRQRRLHDGDARAHHDGGGVEGGHIEHRTAQTGGDAADQQPDDQRRHRAPACDQQRSRHRRDAKQDDRQSGQDADLGSGQVQVGLHHRNDRRHRQNGQPQAYSGEPEQADRNPEFSHGIPGSGVFFVGLARCGQDGSVTSCP